MDAARGGVWHADGHVVGRWRARRPLRQLFGPDDGCGASRGCPAGGAHRTRWSGRGGARSGPRPHVGREPVPAGHDHCADGAAGAPPHVPHARLSGAGRPVVPRCSCQRSADDEPVPPGRRLLGRGAPRSPSLGYRSCDRCHAGVGCDRGRRLGRLGWLGWLGWLRLWFRPAPRHGSLDRRCPGASAVRRGGGRQRPEPGEAGGRRRTRAHRARAS